MANYKSRYTGEEIDAGIAKANTAIQDVSNKVDKIEGKGLSTNDYTTEEKTKLADIDMSSKQDTLVSGENIKTINNQSLLGSGNITIQGGGGETSPLEGKTLLAIGDSFVYGHSLGHTSGKTWEEKIASRNNMTLKVYATNGISLGGSNSSTISKGLESAISNISSADYIVILGGHNDANASLNGGSQVPIGSNTDTEYTTFKGAINYMISKLQTKYPSSFILFCTPFLRNGTEEPYAEAMKEVCAYNSIPCFDDFHNSGLNFTNAAMKSLYELSGSKHFNEAGQLRLSYVYESLLKNYLSVNAANTKQVEFVSNSTAYANLTKNKDTFYIVNGVGIYFNNALILSQGTVTPKELVSIAITTPPTKTAYKVGQTFDPTGMVVTATYDDYSQEEISDYTYSPTSQLTLEDTTITISYTRGSVTKTATQSITVSEGVFVSLSSIVNSWKYASGQQNRASWYGTLPAGVTIDFSTNLSDTYKYAIGPGNSGSSTPWIGGGYQDGAFTTTEETGYTIMWANKLDPSLNIDATTAQALIDTFGYIE